MTDQATHTSISSSTNNPDKITRRVAVAVIGAGTAGQNAFRTASKTTKNIVIINDGFWTTVCATVGCMPSKLLIAAASRAHVAQYSDQFGIHAEVTIDGKQVMARVQAERNFFANSVKKQVNNWPEDKKIAGRAYINKDGLIEVNDQLIQADKIIVATGSSPFIPEGWADKLGDRLLTSDNIFELPDLPESLAVIGAGAIGLEMAQSMSRLGVAVTLFNHKHQVAGLQDDEINEKAIDCLSAGLTMQLNSKVESVDSGLDNKKPVAFINYKDRDGKAQEWQGQYVLVATGRRNNIQPLGIENLGVELDEKNRPKNLDINTGQIGDLEVYIVGDANAHIPLLHVASDEGFSAGSSVCPNNTDANIRPPSIPLSMVFCEPQIANIGMTLPEVKNSGLHYVIGKVNFEGQGRSRVMGVNCGLLHIYSCKETDKILGASMVGPDAEYIAHILAVAITNDLSIKQLLDTPIYHPTIVEGLRTALRNAQHKMAIPYQAQLTQEDGF